MKSFQPIPFPWIINPTAREIAPALTLVLLAPLKLHNPKKLALKIRCRIAKGEGRSVPI